MTNVILVHRFIRLRDAPAYLGMDRNRFNEEVRPSLIEIPIGDQGVAFDRLDLDAWADDYKSCNGRPAAQREGDNLWLRSHSSKRGRRASSREVVSGMSTNRSEADAFAKALAQANSPKQNAT